MMEPTELAHWNTLPPATAAATLRTCCRSEEWVASLLSARPFGTAGQLRARSRAVLEGLSWAQLLPVIGAHPRIGQPPSGIDAEARFSRREQAMATPAVAQARTELLRMSAEYERRWGHVFLIRAADRNSGEILRELHRRLGNTDTAERAECRHELIEIVDLRLAAVFEPVLIV